MRIPLYQVDAFTDRAFSGNPAAVCPLERWLPPETMQAIAAENNLSETAFFVLRKEDDYALRWFTPAVEVDLCGHATLASAKIVFEHLQPGLERVRFQTKSGELSVAKKGELLELDFPSLPGVPCPVSQALVDALGAPPREAHRSRSMWLAVYESEAEVRELAPDFARMTSLDLLGVIATAPGLKRDGVDFVSRFFAPKAGVPEDPVTGSAHCVLVPYWSERLKKKKLHALQVSRRGGELWCEDRPGRVGIAGKAVLVLEGELVAPL